MKYADRYLPTAKIGLNLSVESLNTTSKITNSDDTHEGQDFEDEQQESDLPLSCLTSDVVIYISGFVERTLKKQIKCPECILALNTNNVWYGELINIKNNGKIM